MVDPRQSDFMEPRNEAVREIEKSLENAQNWFVVLARHCEHNEIEMCHKYSGAMLCKLKQCPLINA